MVGYVLRPSPATATSAPRTLLKSLIGALALARQCVALIRRCRARWNVVPLPARRVCLRRLAPRCSFPPRQPRCPSAPEGSPKSSCAACAVIAARRKLLDYAGSRAAGSGRNPRTGATILIPRRAAGRLGLGVLPSVAAGALDDLCH